MRPPLVSLLRRVGGRLSQFRTVARWLFRIDFRPLDPGARYFDVTTPVLVSAAARALGPGKRLLDMGTGAYAVIGLALWRRTGCDVVSTDIRPDVVAGAQANIEAN